MIGMMSALVEEAEALSEKIVETNRLVSGGQTFVCGHLGTTQIVMAISGMGKVNAAITAQKLISEFKVKAVIFSGVAGATGSALEIGDILIAQRAFQHDFGYHSEQLTVRHPGHLPEVGFGDLDHSIFFDLERYYQSDFSFKKMTNFLMSIETNLLPVVLAHHQHQPKIKIGTVATGDQFIANELKKKTLQNLGADVIEMEGASVAQVCKAHQLPLLLIRSVSDKANNESPVNFKSICLIVAKNNSYLVSKAVELWSTHLP